MEITEKNKVVMDIIANYNILISFIFATLCCRVKTFDISNYEFFRSKNLSLTFLRCTLSGCKDIAIWKQNAEVWSKPKMEQFHAVGEQTPRANEYEKVFRLLTENLENALNSFKNKLTLLIIIFRHSKSVTSTLMPCTICKK